MEKHRPISGDLVLLLPMSNSRWLEELEQTLASSQLLEHECRYVGVPNHKNKYPLGLNIWIL